MILVERYESNAHYSQLLESLQELQTSKSSYPPRNLLTSIQPSPEEWLHIDGQEPSLRFVAILEGRVVGHIALTAPHEYMVNFLQQSSSLGRKAIGDLYAEIEMFFVSKVQEQYVEEALLSRILNEARNLGRVPTLTVVESHDSHEAIKLYQKHGMGHLGMFHGEHGKSSVFIHLDF